MALAHGEVAHLLNPNYKEDVRRWLAEDCPSFDYGGFVVGEAITEARLLGKSAVSFVRLKLGFILETSLLSPYRMQWSSGATIDLSKGILAGVPLFDEVFRQLDCTYDLMHPYILLFQDSRCTEWNGISTKALR